MNVIEVQDGLKNFSEQQLIKEMQQPSGNAPQFLVLSELNRRKRVKGDYEARQSQNQPTVAQDAVASAGVPQNQMMGMSEAMAPQSTESGGIGAMMPQTMKNGGEVEEYAEGGVVRAKAGEYFPSSNELYGIYGQESGFGKNLFGSAGEIGPYQILPTTAISPGYGIQSLFPELAQAVAEGKYKDFNEAYLDNKDAVDSVLMSGEKTEPFVKSYLDAAENKLGSRDKALLSYNQGIAGTKNFNEDASKTNYVSGIMSNMQGFDGAKMSRPNFTDGDVKKTKVVYQGGEENKNITSNVPKGVRPDFTIDSIPQNTRELAYLKQLKLQNDLEQNKPRPNLSEILSNKVPQSEDNDGENMGKNIDQKTLDLMSQTEKDFVQNNLFNSNNTIKNEKQPKATTFTDTNQFNNVLKGLITPENVNYVGENLEFNAGANTPILNAEEFKKFQDKIAAGEGANTATTLFGASNNVDMSSDIKNSGQIKKNTVDNTEIKKSNYTFSDGSKSKGISSTEQEILDLQRQLKKDRDFDRYMALAQVGLNLMDQKGYGEAMNTGLKTLGDSQKRYSDGVTSLINARAKLATATGKGVMTTKEAYDKLNDVRERIYGKQGDLGAVTIELKPEERAKYKAEEQFLLEYMNKRGFKIPVYNPNLDAAS